MRKIQRLSLVDQTVAHLRHGLRDGRWSGNLPGVLRLAAELHVSKDTARAALHALEAEGVLKPRGHGRRRAVVDAQAPAPARKLLRIAILTPLRMAEENGRLQHMGLRLRLELEAAGHVCVFAEKSQRDLKDDPRRAQKLVEETKADAWIVAAGSFRLNEWFSKQEFPTLAIGGRIIGLPIAATGSRVDGTYRTVVKELIELGHRRICFLCPAGWRQPSWGTVPQAVGDELAANGVTVGGYNVPDWEETPEGLREVLRSLFQVTPPTALIVTEFTHAVTALGYLAQRGLQVPRDVSFVCGMNDPALHWHRPRIAHFREDLEAEIRHVTRWANAALSGKVDRRQMLYPAEIERGETMVAPFGSVSRHRDV